MMRNNHKAKALYSKEKMDIMKNVIKKYCDVNAQPVQN